MYGFILEREMITTSFLSLKVRKKEIRFYFVKRAV